MSVSSVELHRDVNSRAAVLPLVILSGVLLYLLLINLDLLSASHLGTLALGVTAFSFVLVGRSPDYDLLNPVRVFGALWCLCLALASMRLLPLISKWDFEMWSCVLTALVSFTGGFWIVRHFSATTPNSMHSMLDGETLPWRLSSQNTLYVATACLIIGTAVLVFEYRLIGGIPILSDNPDATRMELFGFGGARIEAFNVWWIKALHFFVECTKYSVFLALIILVQKGKKTKAVIVGCLSLIVIGTVIYCSQAGRTFAANIVLTSLALVHYLRRRIRLIELTWATLALFLFVALFGSYRIQQSNSAPEFDQFLKESGFPTGGLGAALAFGYFTTTASLQTFDNLTTDLKSYPHPSSGYLFYAFHSLVPRSNLGDTALDLYSGEFVTTTFLGEFYADYGYWGVLVGPLLLGAAYGWVYSLGDRRKTVYRIYVRCLLFQMLVFFPYVNLFSQYLTWIFDLSAMYLLFRISQGPSGRAHPIQPVD